MKHRNISFYLNTAFVVVLAAVIAFIGVAGVKFFHRWSVENVVDRLEVALVDAEGLLQGSVNSLSHFRQPGSRPSRRS